MNTFGTIYRLTTFGESHGPAIGGVIDGVPAGVAIDLEQLQRALDRRRPGQSSLTTQRREADCVTLLSGIFEGKTMGTPIGFTIPNSDSHSSDYEHLRDAYRPSHADYTYTAKYGIRDHRGGGRSSARETACRVVGGAIASQILASKGIEIVAYTSQVGDVVLESDHTMLDLSMVDSSAVRCPDAATAEAMQRLIESVKAEGDTIGGVVTCIVKGVPVGLGSPVFGKLNARLAAAMMSINAAKGVEFGMGFEGAKLRGSEANDRIVCREGRVRTLTNHSGGIQGGISNGEEIVMRIAFKPVATLMMPTPTINDKGEAVTLEPRGRHDACVVPRAVPVVEAMAAMTILDELLIAQTVHL